MKLAVPVVKLAQGFALLHISYRVHGFDHDGRISNTNLKNKRYVFFQSET